MYFYKTQKWNLKLYNSLFQSMKDDNIANYA